jgi:hypothetical protein
MEDGGKKCIYITKMTTQTKRSRHTQEPGAAFASIQKNIERPPIWPRPKRKKNLLEEKRAEGERERDTAEKPFKRFLRSLQSSPRGTIAHTYTKYRIFTQKKRWSNQQRKRKRGPGANRHAKLEVLAVQTDARPLWHTPVSVGASIEHLL